ncbi:hypothetical protein [Alkalinema sp. FACHB-956]|uniref:hypothetical protein n=1 Tax=Alkalinema sp. FACHB-956 TaxID=2692768 RepID=UPI001687B21D|nr:hypothetical protein [Alkalinema sp. FACHB-956]MBD2328281.1 hypothetical protein [Alkalinema sp. FACHB-956]
MPFLIEGANDAGQCINLAVEQNSGVLLHYFYGSDHGIWLRFYEASQECCTIAFNNDCADENDWDLITRELLRLGLLDQNAVEALQSLRSEAFPVNYTNLPNLRQQLGQILGVEFLEWFGCADLSFHSPKAIAKQFPDAKFVLKSLRGKAENAVQPEPNEWCPEPDFPTFMYLPVPDGVVDEALLERHVQHWLETNDWDETRQVGFWLYSGYQRALPSRMRYLAERIMNLQLVFGQEGYERELRRTIRGILAVTDRSFDWQPYLDRRAGEIRL